jgi:molybdopterin synthase catalytic subunit
MAELTHQPIDAARLLREAARPDCGAIDLFLGTTRNHHDGRAVLRLAYEAYEPMALEVLAAIEKETLSQFAIASCRIVHRLGEVPPGEASVAVVVAAAHRAAAFDACRQAMDQVKSRAPIWKREHFGDGDAEWVKGTPLGS